MDPVEYLYSVRRRWRLAAGVALAVVALAAGWLLLVPRSYVATASVVVDVPGQGAQSRLSSGLSYAQAQVGTYSALAELPVVLRPVVDELDLPTTPEELARSVRVDARLDSVVMEISATDPSPTRAADVADAVAAELSDAVAGLVPDARGGGAQAQVDLLSPAATPTRPSGPRRRLTLEVAVALAALLGSLAAVLADRPRGQVARAVTDEARYARVVPLASFQGRGRPPAPGSGRRRPLGRTDRGEVERLLGHVRRAVAEQGSSVAVVPVGGVDTADVTAALARALADDGLAVLLVDAAPGAGGISGVLGLPRGGGLEEVLRRPDTLGREVRRWEGAGVDVLPATPVLGRRSAGGQVDPRALSSLLRAATSGPGGYDVVLLDCPLGPWQARGLTVAGAASATVVVAEARRRWRSQLAAGAASLAAPGTPVLGAVLIR